MSDAAAPRRTPALDVAPLLLPGLALRVPPPSARLSLRCAPAEAARLEPAFGAAILVRPLTSVRSGARAALWLGPDEWLLLAEAGAEATLAAALRAALGEAPGSVVDVSHRQVAIEVEGTRAAALLNAGCPLDLDDATFPPGACARTLFGKVEIVVWRPEAAPRYRVEAARSFVAHLWEHLAGAARDLD